MLPVRFHFFPPDGAWHGFLFINGPVVAALFLHKECSRVISTFNKFELVFCKRHKCWFLCQFGVEKHWKLYRTFDSSSISFLFVIVSFLFLRQSKCFLKWHNTEVPWDLRVPRLSLMPSSSASMVSYYFFARFHTILVRVWPCGCIIAPPQSDLFLDETTLMTIFIRVHFHPLTKCYIT